MSTPKWEKVGKVAIDSGLCWLGDPSYVIHKQEPAPDLGDNWKEFVKRVFHRERKALGVAQFVRDGQDGFSGLEPQWNPLGCTVDTGYGDGIYDVEVQRNDEGRIAAVRIVFINLEEGS